MGLLAALAQLAPLTPVRLLRMASGHARCIATSKNSFIAQRSCGASERSVVPSNQIWRSPVRSLAGRKRCHWAVSFLSTVALQSKLHQPLGLSTFLALSPQRAATFFKSHRRGFSNESWVGGRQQLERQFCAQASVGEQASEGNSDSQTEKVEGGRGPLLNDGGQASTSSEAAEKSAQKQGFAGRRVWRRAKPPAAVEEKGPRAAKDFLEQLLEAQTNLSPEASSLLTDLQAVDSDPERLAILEKKNDAKLSNGDLLELLRRQRGYRTARLFFDWMETQPGYQKGLPDAYHILLAFAYRSQATDAPGEIVSEMDQKGVAFNSKTYAALIEVYSRTKQIEIAEAWFEKFQIEQEKNKWRTESRAYRAMMKLYEKVGKPSEMVRMWRALLAQGGVHTNAVRTYNNLLHQLGMQGMFDEMMDLCDEMKGKGLQPNTATYNILINAYGKKEARHQALKLFEEMQSASVPADSVTYNTLISIHVKAEDYTEAAKTMQLMRESGQKPNEYTLNAMLRAYAKLEQAQEALDVYSRFRDAGIKPGASSYNALIHLLVASGKADAGEMVLKEMQEGGTPPSEITWNGLISAYNKAKMYEKAVESFRRMSAAGLSPNQNAYTPAIDALFHLEKDDEAMEMFDEMRSAGIQPRSMTYGIMLIVCARNDMLGEAMALLDEMRDRGIPPTDNHYINVVDGLVRAGRWEEAQAVYRAAREEGRAGAQLYACLVCGLEARGEKKQAEELFKTMKAAGVDTAEAIYGSLISALGRLGRYEDAMTAYQAMESSGSEPKERTYSQIVSVYGKAGLVGPAEAVFKVAARLGETSMRVHNALIDVYLRGGLFQDAEEWYTTMQDEGLEADESTCRTFLVRYAEAGLWQPASRWLNKTMSSNFLFEATTYNKVLRCFGSAGKIDLAWMLFHIMKAGSKAAKPSSSTYNTMIGILGEEGRYKDAAALVQEMRSEGVEINDITKAILRRIVYAANSSSHSKREVDVAIDEAFGRQESRASKFAEGRFVPSSSGTQSSGTQGGGDAKLPDYLRELSRL